MQLKSNSFSRFRVAFFANDITIFKHEMVTKTNVNVSILDSNIDTRGGGKTSISQLWGFYNLDSL